MNETKPILKSRTIWAAGATGIVSTLAAVDPGGGVGGAIAYLLQVALGIALSHGTDVNRPEIDLGQVVNAGLIVGGTIATWLSRIVSTKQIGR